MPGEKEGGDLKPQNEDEEALVEINAKVGVDREIRPKFFEQEARKVRRDVQKMAQDALDDEIAVHSIAILELGPKLKQLKEVGEKRFMMPGAVFEALEQVSLVVPHEEKVRLLAEFVRELKSEGFDAFIARSRAIRDASEGKEPPLIAKLPLAVAPKSDASDVKIFTIDAMHAAIRESKQAGHTKKALYFSNYLLPEIWNQQWGSALRTWTGACLEGSGGLEYEGHGGQLWHQREVLGEGYEIHADVFLAMILNSILTDEDEDEDIMSRGIMRLNHVDGLGNPLSVHTVPTILFLHSGEKNATNVGMGGSVEISRDS